MSVSMQPSTILIPSSSTSMICMYVYVYVYVHASSSVYVCYIVAWLLYIDRYEIRTSWIHLFYDISLYFVIFMYHSMIYIFSVSH